MTSNTKNKKRKSELPLGVVDKSVGNYGKHPFFVKKAKEAKALIKKVGLPKVTKKPLH